VDFNPRNLRLAALFLVALVQQPPMIRVTTKLIEISVVVHDKKGEPVRRLRKEDFTLFENGHKRPIDSFAANEEAATPVTSPNAFVPPLPGGYSNRANIPGQVSIILFDRFNTTFLDQPYARAQVLRFVRQIRPGDKVAIYVLRRDTVRVLHDFTSNPELLEQAIATLTAQSKGLDGASSGVADSIVTELTLGQIPAYITQDPRWTLRAMEGIANHLASLPGRKNLIWVSSSFPFTIATDASELALGKTSEQRSYTEQAIRTTRAVENANVALYPVDARGLLTDPAISASNPNLSSRSLPLIFSPPGIDTSRQLADLTGGRAFDNRNDIDKAIQTAVNDARVSYNLGFYAQEKDWDGKFHKFEVKVSRPGVDVRYRKGFLAVATPAATDADIEAQTRTALASSLEATAVGLIAMRTRSGSIALHVDGGDITLTQQGASRLGKLHIVFAQFAADDTLLETKEVPMPIELPDMFYETIKRNGMTMSEDPVKILPNTEVLKIVVVDVPTGRIGSLRVPIGSAAPR
jgi:VWFA-related protein